MLVRHLLGYVTITLGATPLTKYMGASKCQGYKRTGPTKTCWPLAPIIEKVESNIENAAPFIFIILSKMKVFQCRCIRLDQFGGPPHVTRFVRNQNSFWKGAAAVPFSVAA